MYKYSAFEVEGPHNFPAEQCGVSNAGRLVENFETLPTAIHEIVDGMSEFPDTIPHVLIEIVNENWQHVASVERIANRIIVTTFQKMWAIVSVRDRSNPHKLIAGFIDRV